MLGILNRLYPQCGCLRQFSNWI